MKTQLFIEEYEIELDKSVQFAITKQFEDLSSPTTIINDWSKTVSIPFTENNNKIFGMLFRTDRTGTKSDTSSTGLYFNPNKKLDFKLIHNGDLVISGYAKILSIKKNNGRGSYELNLFGKLGEIFSELNNITVFYPEDEEQMKYYVGDVFKDIISKELVYKSWTTYPQMWKSLQECDTTDIIGFSCVNQGYNDNKFSSDSYQYDVNKTIQMKDFPIDGKTLEEKYKEENLSWDSVMKDGITPRAWGEYRSYHQIPFIYIPRMFEILQNKCEELTGYKLLLHDSWFNYKNPYYKQLVMMLNKTSRDGSSGTKHNSYMMSPMNVNGGWSLPNIQKGDYINIWRKNVEIISEEKPILNGGVLGEDFTLSTDYTFKVKLPYKFRMEWVNSINGDAHIYPGMVFYMDVVARGENGYEKILKRTIIKTPNAVYTPDKNVDEKVINTSGSLLKEKVNDSRWKYYMEFEDEFQGTFDYGVYGNSVDFFWKGYFITKTTPMSIIAYGSNSPILFGSTSGDIVNFYPVSTPVQVNIDLISESRSNSGLNLGNVWNKDKSFFGEILRYTKMFRLMWDVDNINKTITIIPNSAYFSNYTVEDWTNKVDFNKNFEITPILLDNKYFAFNYEDSEITLNNEYKKLYGKNYGELLVKTNYAFNNSTKNLFEKNKLSLTATESFLPWSSIKNRNFTYSVPSEIMPSLHTDENKSVNGFGQYYFYKGIAMFDNPVYITDDTDWMKNNSQYMYISSNEYGANSVSVNRYPLLDVVYEDKMCTYNVPMKSYCKDIDYSGNSSIYSNFWKDIMENEILSLDAHKLVSYVRLTPSDFNNFKFNHFVTINNQLYLVNKISDYSFDNLLTKCEFIKVLNPENYTKNNIDYKGIETSSEGGMGYVNGAKDTELHRVAYIFSLYDVNFTNGTKILELSNGIRLTIKKCPVNEIMLDGTEYNYVIYRESYTQYSSASNNTCGFAITNGYTTLTNFSITRYSDYPYPPVLNVSQTTVNFGTGTFNIEFITQMPPKNITFTGSNGCTFTLGAWEEFNNDYYGYRVTCNYNNQSIASNTEEIGKTYPVILKVISGTDYEVTTTLNVKKGVKTHDGEIML